jgi:hypothetical protein
MNDSRQWFRVKPSYQKPAGGFLATGPRYLGQIVDDGKAVRFQHHGAPEWIEVEPIDQVEASPSGPPRRRRWK